MSYRTTRNKTRIRRTWGASEQKIIAARQQWKCAVCAQLLPSAYECDHIIPLWDGGPDCYRTNAQALCGTCHCEKTQRENVQRRIMERERRHAAILAARAQSPIPALDDTQPAAMPIADPIKRPRRADPDIDLLQDNPFIKYAFVPEVPSVLTGHSEKEF